MIGYVDAKETKETACGESRDSGARDELVVEIYIVGNAGEGVSRPIHGCKRVKDVEATYYRDVVGILEAYHAGAVKFAREGDLPGKTLFRRVAYDFCIRKVLQYKTAPIFFSLHALES